MRNPAQLPLSERSTLLRARYHAALTGLALLAVALEHTLGPDPNLLHLLGPASIGLLLGLCWGRKDPPPLADLLLWPAATASTLLQIWLGDGLQDVALLCVPLVLSGAALDLPAKPAFVLFAATALLLPFIGLAGIGANSAAAATSGSFHLAVTLVVLAAAAILAWVIAADVRSSRIRHAEQLEEARRSEKDLTYLAQHDALTSLPNRGLGSQLLAQGIANSTRNKNHMAMLFVDLDNFKDINDSLGHAAGDEFLQLVANRLRTAVRKSDIVCRQGGDEFLIGLQDIGDIQSITSIASHVLEQVTQTCTLRDTEIMASCSIGIAVHPKDGSSYEELLRHADLAMYQAKEAGRNTFRFFNDETNASASENLHLVATLRSAIGQKEFELHYQPVLDLNTGALVGAEALIRWRNPKFGLVSPALFIPAAEKSGLIVDIGQWVLEEACRQMQAWREQGAPPLTIAVNLSPVQFRRGDVEDIIERTLQKTGLDPQCLELEVTESTLVQDTEKFIQSLQRIKALGIRISIDDFGTGYSNLSYLQRFAVDKLKIDQSFVKRLTGSPQDLAIVTAIIQMAKSLHLTTNAEGVEDAATRDQLTAIGCELAQGYFFARPLPAAQFEAYMKEHKALPASVT